MICMEVPFAFNPSKFETLVNNAWELSPAMVHPGSAAADSHHSPADGKHLLLSARSGFRRDGFSRSFKIGNVS
jgi:hypothetical protein